MIEFASVMADIFTSLMKGFSPLFFPPHEFYEFTRITKRLDNGDLFGRTNFH